MRCDSWAYFVQVLLLSVLLLSDLLGEGADSGEALFADVGLSEDVLAASTLSAVAPALAAFDSA